MPEPPIFLDSNVFLYAVGAAHPLREGCQAVLRRVADGSLSATTSAEVVQECLHVLTRRGRGEEARRLARRILGLFPQILPVTGAALADACELLERHPTLRVRDAIHAATMRGHGMVRILTADRHFDLLTDLVRIEPAGARGG